MISVAVFCIVLAASAACPYGTRGRLPYVIVKGVLLGVLGVILGAAEAMRGAR